MSNPPKAAHTAAPSVPQKRIVERKPRGRGFERRDEILSAAARLFVEFGFANVTTRRIAEAIGISQTALYVYFPNRDAILDELCERCFAKLLEIFDREAEEGGDSLQVLRRMMYAYVHFGVENRDEYRICFMLEHSNEAKLLALERGEEPAGMRCYSKLQDQVEAVGREGRLRCDAILASQAVWAAGHGLIALLITMPMFPWAPRQELVDLVVEIQLRGLLKT